MKKSILLFVMVSMYGSVVLSQEQRSTFENLPLIVSIQFHSLSMPFKNLKSNFRNVGIGLGTEISYGDSPNWLQRLTVIYYLNGHVGGGIGLLTHAIWRPYFTQELYGETQMGVGFVHVFRPVDSYVQREGQWVNVGKRGKTLIAVPVGLTLGVENKQFSPFVGYQFLLLNNYNKSISLVPNTLIQVGTHLQKN